MKQLHYIQLQIHFCTICLPCCCFWAQIWKARVPTHRHRHWKRHRNRTQKRKNTVAYRTAHRCSFYGWLATEFLDSSLAQFAWLLIVWMPVQKTKRTNRAAATPCPPPSARPPFSLPASPASCANICLKTLRWNAFAVECQALLRCCCFCCCLSAEKKNRTGRKGREGGEYPSSCERISKAASQCPKLLLSAAGRRTKCEQTVEISKALLLFRCINKFECAQVLQGKCFNWFV